ncbi:Aminoglycoside phosphotransferase domain-containing protein [Stackebrandtia soli]
MPVMSETTPTLPPRTQQALDAAVTIGRDLGLSVSDASVIYDVFSVVVHLAPSPVVVRIPTVLPKSARPVERQQRRQRDELGVASWLVENGHPAIGPSPLVPREPVDVDGLSMTFWQWVEQDHGAEPDYIRNTASTATLHAILRDYDGGHLPFLSPAASIEPCLTELSENPDLIDADDLERAWREWRILKPVVSSAEGLLAVFPDASVQTIHGDSPPFNLIETTSGPLFSDFEDVTVGPIEWDLTLTGDEAIAAYDAAATAKGSRPVDRKLLAVMESLRMLQVVACLTLVDELPILAEGLKPSIEQWRGMPLAGGLD